MAELIQFTFSISKNPSMKPLLLHNYDPDKYSSRTYDRLSVDMWRRDARHGT